MLYPNTELPSTIPELEDPKIIELRLVDRAYFEKNPKHGSYRREASKAEKKRHKGCQWVDVLAVSPGGEARLKFFRPGNQAEADGDSKMARAYASAWLVKMSGGQQ